MTRLGFLVMLVFGVFGCNNPVEYVEEMRPLVLENGMQVSSCAEYEQMRSAFRVHESVANKRVSADYLACSMSLGLQVDENSELTMRTIFHGLLLRDLPISLSSSFDSSQSLSGAGFELWLEKSMLSYNDSQRSILIQYKGMLKNSNHLVWVSDIANAGNYAAFFPAIIITQDAKVLGTAPVYASGY